MNSHLKIINLLLKAGHSAYLTDHEGNTPLQLFLMHLSTSHSPLNKEHLLSTIRCFLKKWAIWEMEFENYLIDYNKNVDVEKRINIEALKQWRNEFYRQIKEQYNYPNNIPDRVLAYFLGNQSTLSKRTADWIYTRALASSSLKIPNEIVNLIYLYDLESVVNSPVSETLTGKEQYEYDSFMLTFFNLKKETLIEKIAESMPHTLSKHKDSQPKKLLMLNKFP